MAHGVCLKHAWISKSRTTVQGGRDLEGAFRATAFRFHKLHVHIPDGRSDQRIWYRDGQTKINLRLCYCCDIPRGTELLSSHVRVGALEISFHVERDSGPTQTGQLDTFPRPVIDLHGGASDADRNLRRRHTANGTDLHRLGEARLLGQTMWPSECAAPIRIWRMCTTIKV